MRRVSLLMYLFWLFHLYLIVGETIRSPVDGKPQLYYPREKRARQELMSRGGEFSRGCFIMADVWVSVMYCTSGKASYHQPVSNAPAACERKLLRVNFVVEW
jgi:hypothetical protein